jgi:cytochrome c556
MPAKFTTAALVAIALVAAATPLIAATSRGARAPAAPPPAEVIRARIAGYREMGAAFKNINDSLRGTPQMVVIQQSARTIRNTSQAQYGWFPAGTGPATGLKTTAKPEIWAQPAQFRAAQDQLARAAATLDAAAVSSNIDAIKAAARGLGGACKNCHDQFRVPPQK